MKILQNAGGIADTNSFLVADEAAKQAVIFDAPNDTTGELLDEAQRQGWDVIGLWLTHGHFDHIADHAVVTARFPGCKVLIHAADERMLQDTAAQLQLFGLPLNIPSRSADGQLTEGQTLSIGNIRVLVLHTPGHSAGSVAFHMPDEKYVVGGDLIIQGAVGRTDLPDSDAQQFAASIRRIMALPGDTRLMPGHGEITSLDEERSGNLYVRMILSGKTL